MPPTPLSGLGFSPDALRGSAETARCRPSRGTTAPDTAPPTTPAAGPPAANRWTGLVVLVVVNVQLLDVDDVLDGRRAWAANPDPHPPSPQPLLRGVEWRGQLRPQWPIPLDARLRRRLAFTGKADSP